MCDDVYGCMLLRWLVRTPTAHDRLFDFGYNYYNQSLKHAEQRFGMQAGWTAHSGRAGFATDLIVQGETVATVQARGRWLSESSFRCCYVDVIGPRHQSKSAGASSTRTCNLWFSAWRA